MNKDITVVVPVHKIDEDIKELLTNAINSVSKQNSLPNKILYVIDENDAIESFIRTLEVPSSVEVNIIRNKNIDYQSQINFAASKVTTKYFTILEVDDEYNSIWFKEFKKYLDFNEDVKCFLPFIYEYSETGKFIKMTNDAAWSAGFSDELGFYELEVINKYPDVSINGMIIETKTFIELGGLKSNIKATFNYEFILRLLNNNEKVFIIPKVGYLHVNNRKDSLSEGFSKMSQEESLFWLNTAKKEYFYKTDRLVNFISKL